MANIFQEVDEDLRRDQATVYWKKYGKFAIAGLVCIVVVTASAVGWKEYRLRQQVQYSDQFSSALALIQDKKDADATNVLAMLATDANIGYATLARFREAALSAQKGNGASAAAVYDALANDSSVDPLYAGLAALYYVLHQIQTGDPETLSKRLEPLLAEDNAWRHSAIELTALLALRQGDATKAEADYTRLADDPKTPTGIRARAAEMLRALKQQG